MQGAGTLALLCVFANGTGEAHRVEMPRDEAVEAIMSSNGATRRDRPARPGGGRADVTPPSIFPVDEPPARMVGGTR